MQGLAHTADGVRLTFEELLPEGSPAAVAVLGHAMMVDRSTLRRLAETLVGQGIATICFDVRGHGHSGVSARDGGQFCYDDFVRYDVPTMVATARSRLPKVPVVVVGHSLIGHAALIAAGHEPKSAPDGIVAIAANLWAPRFEPRRWARVVKGTSLALWLAASTPRGYFDAQRFGVGTEAEPLAYLRQFLSFWLSDRLMSVDGLDDWLAALRRAELPVLAISSEGDRLLGRPEAIERFMSTLHRADAQHRVVRRGELAPGFAPNHMQLVTSPRSEPLWREIATWIRKVACADDGDGSRSRSVSS